MTADRGLRPHPRPLSRRARGEDAPGADCPLSCWGAGFYIDEQDGQDDRGVGVCHCAPVLDAGVGSLDGVAGNEIAAWFDRLTMSGCAPRNDKGAGIATWFDRLTMSGCAPHNDRAALLAMTGAVVGLCPHTSRRVRHPECYAAVGVVLVMGNGVQQLWRPFFYNAVQLLSEAPADVIYARDSDDQKYDLEGNDDDCEVMHARQFNRSPPDYQTALTPGPGPFDSPSPLVGEGWGEGYSLPQDSSLSHTFTLTPVLSTGQALTLSHQGRGDFL